MSLYFGFRSRSFLSNSFVISLSLSLSLSRTLLSCFLPTFSRSKPLKFGHDVDNDHPPEPDQPYGIRRTTTSIQISWEALLERERIVRYEIKYNTRFGFGWNTAPPVSVNKSASAAGSVTKTKLAIFDSPPMCTLTGLDPDTAYVFTVRCMNDRGFWSEYSDTSEVVKTKAVDCEVRVLRPSCLLCVSSSRFFLHSPHYEKPVCAFLIDLLFSSSYLLPCVSLLFPGFSPLSFLSSPLCFSSLLSSPLLVFLQEPTHLIVCAHGIANNEGQMKFLESQLMKLPGSDNFAILKSAANAALMATRDGIAVGGHRLAMEVIEYVKYHPDVCEISMIGHNTGGLYIRYAAGVLLINNMFPDLLKPMNFITLGTPHLGSGGTMLSDDFAAVLCGDTGEQLSLKDGAANGEEPMLLQMCHRQFLQALL